jgi:hypothetical protein
MLLSPWLETVAPVVEVVAAAYLLSLHFVAVEV